MKDVHIEHWVQAKEQGNVELKRTVSHLLSNGVRTILEWFDLPMGCGKAFFLQVKPNFEADLKLV